MKILVTGAAGFIGFYTALELLKQNNQVIGIDNLNDYYDPKLKNDRLDILKKYINFSFQKIDIADNNLMQLFFEKHNDIDYIIHLAAQAGVRYSTENPKSYIDSNIIGHFNILNNLPKLSNLKLFIYASSSSVYGANDKLPFSVEDKTDSPISLYAATKKCTELLSHSYAHIYKIPMIGLRFFTVYGPWGRPDMATYLFTDAIFNDKPISVFNKGNMQRDFTYIDDIVKGILNCIGTENNIAKQNICHKVYNLGNNKSEKLGYFISILEKSIGKKAIIEYKEKHIGDVDATYADIEISKNDLSFSPQTSIDQGLPKFVDWYKEYKGIK